MSPLWAGTGLHEAAATGNVDALRAQWDRLLAADGDDEHPEAALDSTAPDGRVWADSVLHSSLRRTPLMLAALGGHERMVAALLAMGVDATLADAIGRTALQLAASEAVRKLLACVAPVAERLALNDQLLSAAKAKDTDGVAAALAAGAFPEAWDAAQGVRSRGLCPLHRACDAGNLDMVLALLAYGADIEVACRFHGDTPLLYACREGRVDIIAALLRAGADIERPSRERGGSSPMTRPLFFAMEFSWSKWSKTVALLLSHGANTEARDGSGGSALCVAVEGCQVKMVEMLLEHGADVGFTKHDGRTLHAVLSDDWCEGHPRSIQLIHTMLRAAATERGLVWSPGALDSDDDCLGRGASGQDDVAPGLAAQLTAMTARAEAAEAELEEAGAEQAALRTRVASLKRERAAQTAGRDAGEGGAAASAGVDAKRQCAK